MKAIVPIFLFMMLSLSLEATTYFKYRPKFDTRLPADLKIHSVTVAGSFNNWNKEATPLKRFSDGSYHARINLSPGLYYYKFVVNGHIWLEDLTANYKLRRQDSPQSSTFNSGVYVMDETQIHHIPDWARDAVWYQIFPERFRNGDRRNDPTVHDLKKGNIPGWKIRDWGSDWYALDPWEENFGGFDKSVFERRYGGDLQGIFDKLDYLQWLGITAIYLNPVFESPSLHKYDGSSFHHIDVTLGPDPAGDRALLARANETDDPRTWVWTEADKMFLRLVREIHRRGMKVIIDGVFNHSGRYFFAFQDVLKNKEQSRYSDWYDVKNWNANNPDGFEYAGWFGHASLPEFKETERGFSPGYLRYLFNITQRWMAPNGRVQDGIDGWRLDVAFCVQHQFWKIWRKHVKSINPNAYITAELWEESPEYLQGDEFDALMNYPFAHSVTEFIIDQKHKITPSEFDRRLEIVKNSYPKKVMGVLQNLMSSHDTARLRSLITNPDLKYRDTSYNFGATKVSSNHHYDISRGDERARRIHKLIVLLQMTYLGAPMVYYGDEVGMSGANDPDCRKPMVWADINYDYEQAHPISGFSRPVEANMVDYDLLNFYRRLIALRHRHPALKRGGIESFHIDDQKGTYGFMRYTNEERVMVLVNSTDHPQTISHGLKEGRYQDLITGQTFTVSRDRPLWIDRNSGLVFRAL